MADTDPITREEMVEMFGSEMPIEAAQLIFNSPDTKTFGEIRAELRAIAAAKPKSTSPSEGAIEAVRLVARLWYNKYGILCLGDEAIKEGATIIDRHLLADAVVREAIRSMEAIIVRCEEGDKRSDWLPVIANLAREAIRALQAERGGG